MEETSSQATPPFVTVNEDSPEHDSPVPITTTNTTESGEKWSGNWVPLERNSDDDDDAPDDEIPANASHEDHADAPDDEAAAYASNSHDEKLPIGPHAAEAEMEQPDHSNDEQEEDMLAAASSIELDVDGQETIIVMSPGDCNDTKAEEEGKEESKHEEEEEEEQLDVISRVLNSRAANFETIHKDAHYQDDALNDMTWGRRLARYLSTRFKWYDPSRHDPSTHAPSLDTAWAYFEHSTLPRHYPKGSQHNDASHLDTVRQKSFHQRQNKNDLLKMAEYGTTEKTELYNVFTTPESELGDFGISVGIYFFTMRILAIICLVAGLIMIPNMLYFSSDYAANRQSGLAASVRGSAVCTDTMWVPCPTCTQNDWRRFPSTYSRFATAENDSLTFILRNNCNVTFRQGLVAWIALVFVSVSILLLNLVSKRRERFLDQQSQTTQDYSILVVNPPPDAFDPDEWKEFFCCKWFHNPQVAAITVALDNEKLIRALVARRQALKSLEYSLKPGIVMDYSNVEEMAQQCQDVAAWQRKLLMTKTGPELLERIKYLEDEARKFAKEEMNVTSIFVTFETESAQRNVLNALSFPGYKALFGGIDVNEYCKFRGEHVLHVVEPSEPNAVRWDDLAEPFRVRVVQRIVSFLVTIAAIIFGAFLVTLAGRESPIWASLMITSINQVTPRVCKAISNRFESHSSDDSRQTSLYIKMTIFKWVNTAVVTALITPFVYTVEPQDTKLIRKVHAIFFAELLTNPLLLVSDIWGHIQRHILGPRAAGQERMNTKFIGGLFLISLRYTELTKILFLTFFYSAIYPAGFFFAAASLAVNYYADKFCLLRVYGPAASVGTKVAEFSRTYFFTSALAVFALMVSYNYAGFPFDNACNTGETVPEEYEGTFEITTGTNDPEFFTVTVNAADESFQYCLQDMLRFSNPSAFPAIPSLQRDGLRWMEDGQERATSLLGWTSVVVIVVVGCIFVMNLIRSTIGKFFFKLYKDVGHASAQPFSETREPYGYIPSVKVPGFQYPLLASDVSDVDDGLVSFHVPFLEYPYDDLNLIHDIPDLCQDKQIFATIKHWQHRRGAMHRD